MGPIETRANEASPPPYRYARVGYRLSLRVGLRLCLCFSLILSLSPCAQTRTYKHARSHAARFTRARARAIREATGSRARETSYCHCPTKIVTFSPVFVMPFCHVHNFLCCKIDTPQDVVVQNMARRLHRVRTVRRPANAAVS